MVTLEGPTIAWFEEDLPDLADMMGGKGASLSRLRTFGLPVPSGFVVCAPAFSEFLNQDCGAELILESLKGLDIYEDTDLERASCRIRDFITAHSLPDAISECIQEAYGCLGNSALVAVRSSAIGEDGEAASFAGQQETFLNVHGADEVSHRVRECWASFFTPRALFYRAERGVLTDMHMAVVVQEMVAADKSGVMFTIDPVQKRRDHMVIEAVFGLGEGIVSGSITPDHYVVSRADGTLVREFISNQPTAILCDPVNGGTQHVQLAPEEGSARVLSDSQLEELRDLGLKIERFFGSPQDVEWCIRADELLLLQSRPITTM